MVIKNVKRFQIQEAYVPHQGFTFSSCVGPRDCVDLMSLNFYHNKQQENKKHKKKKDLEIKGSQTWNGH